MAKSEASRVLRTSTEEVAAEFVEEELASTTSQGPSSVLRMASSTETLRLGVIPSPSIQRSQGRLLSSRPEISRHLLERSR